MPERNGLVVPQAQRHKRKYKRWQPEMPKALWQLDLVGEIYLAETWRECKMVSGTDDRSRFVVCATVLAVPSGRAVADAFTMAMNQALGMATPASLFRPAVSPDREPTAVAPRAKPAISKGGDR